MANKKKTVYVCAECGYETANWAGKCPSCGSWNSMKELTLDDKPGIRSDSRRSLPKAKKMSQLDTEAEVRFATGISEFDRVLGGGAVLGSLNLVGGAPGIGKSTLLLQMCATLEPDRTILYVTAEESAGNRPGLRAYRPASAPSCCSICRRMGIFQPSSRSHGRIRHRHTPFSFCWP